MARAHQQYDLPFRPIANVIRVAVDHRDERQLQGKPEQLHENPEQEIRFEPHLPHDGVLPQLGIDCEITPRIHFNLPRPNISEPLASRRNEPTDKPRPPRPTGSAAPDTTHAPSSSP